METANRRLGLRNALLVFYACLAASCSGPGDSATKDALAKLDKEMAIRDAQTRTEIIKSTKKFCTEFTESIKDGSASETAKSFDDCVARMLQNSQISDVDRERSQVNAARQQQEITDLHKSACQIDPASSRC